MIKMQFIHGILTCTLFLGYLILWYIKRRALLRSNGVEANVADLAVKPIQKYFWSLERVMTVVAGLLIFAHTFFKNSIPALHFAGFLDNQLSVLLGFVLGVLGLTLCRMAQVAIGKSWRVGIDENAKPGLVTNGIYRYVRNPTYTGLFMMCGGVWIMNPTFAFGYWVLVFFLMMEFLVRCEEEYLLSQYGGEYVCYCSRSKRYLPKIY